MAALRRPHGTTVSVRGSLLPAARVQRLCIALCTAILIGLAVSFVLLLRGSVQIEQADTIVFYAAGKLVSSGHGGLIYSFPTLKHIELRVFPHALITEGSFLYPPYAALAFVPLGLLPYKMAYFGWLAFNLVLLAVSVSALQRYVDLSSSAAVLLWVASLSFLPVFTGAIQGQTSILIFALLTVFLLAERNGYSALAGTALALALLKPVLIIPLLFVLALRRSWRTLGSFVCGCIVLAAVSALTFGPHIFTAYVDAMKAAGTWHDTPGFVPRANHTLWSFWRLLFPQSLATVLAVLVAACALVGLWQCSVKSPRIELPLGAATIVGILISPHVLLHDLVILILPAAVLLTESARPLRYWLIAIGYIGVLIGAPLIGVIPIQFSVITMVGLLAWFYRSSLNEQHVARDVVLRHSGVPST